LDINIRGEQAHWIKYRKYMALEEDEEEEKERDLIKIEDFKVHHWQYSAG